MLSILGQASGCATQEPTVNRVIVEGTQGNAIIVGQQLPVGTIITYAGGLSPVKEQALAGQGWLLCDGDPISREGYKLLFDVIGSAHGNGDGRLTFSLPDYRGYFLRGVSGESSQDPDADSRTAARAGGNIGNQVGSVQVSTAGPHEHRDHGVFDSSAKNVVIGLVDPRPGMTQKQHASAPGAGNRESRPINAYVHYLIFSGTIQQKMLSGQ